MQPFRERLDSRIPEALSSVSMTFVAGRAAIASRDIDDDLPRIRRFALVAGSALLIVVLAGVEIGPTVAIPALGLTLHINHPWVLGVGLVIICVWASVRYFYYGMVLSISPSRARRALRKGHTWPAMGPIDQALLRYYPGADARSRKEGKTTRIEFVRVPLSTRLLTRWESFDYVLPLSLNGFAVGLWILCRVFSYCRYLG